jgi:hypothetical protein
MTIRPFGKVKSMVWDLTMSFLLEVQRYKLSFWESDTVMAMSPLLRISTKQFPPNLSNYPFQRDKGVESISPMRILVVTHISWRSRRIASLL